MYAREYAKTRGYPYPMILRLCKEGKIPSIKVQKYLVDPDEADEAMKVIKSSPKVPDKTVREKKARVTHTSTSYLERLKKAR